MSTPLLIGIGSPYGDDQVGWRVVEAVQIAALPLSAVRCETPVTTLLALLQQNENVILVDAVAYAAPVGTVLCWSGVDVMQAQSAVSTHGFNLASVLALANSLSLLPRSLRVYGVVIDAGYIPQLPDMPLSLDVAAAVGQVVALLREEVSQKTLDIH